MWWLIGYGVVAVLTFGFTVASGFKLKRDDPTEVFLLAGAMGGLGWPLFWSVYLFMRL